MLGAWGGSFQVFGRLAGASHIDLLPNSLFRRWAFRGAPSIHAKSERTKSPFLLASATAFRDGLEVSGSIQAGTRGSVASGYELKRPIMSEQMGRPVDSSFQTFQVQLQSPVLLDDLVQGNKMYWESRLVHYRAGVWFSMRNIAWESAAESAGSFSSEAAVAA